MKKILTLLTGFTVIFNPSFLTACNLFKPKLIYVEQKLNVANNNIDFDYDEIFNAQSKIEAKTRNEVINKTWSASIQKLLPNNPNKNELIEKLKHCIEKNLIQASEKSVEEI